MAYFVNFHFMTLGIDVNVDTVYIPGTRLVLRYNAPWTWQAHLYITHMVLKITNDLCELVNNHQYSRKVNLGRGHTIGIQSHTLSIFRDPIAAG